MLEETPYCPDDSFVRAQLGRLDKTLRPCPVSAVVGSKRSGLLLRRQALDHVLRWGIYEPETDELVGAGEFFRCKQYRAVGGWGQPTVRLISWEEQTAALLLSHQGCGYYPLVLVYLVSQHTTLVGCDRQSRHNQRAWERAGAELNPTIDRYVLRARLADDGLPVG